jgi:hypothetical protein
MKNLLFLTALCLSACMHEPEIAAHKGAVYGVLSADAHSAFKKKHWNGAGTDSDYGSNSGGGIVYKDNMVDYAKLDELYVGLIQPGSTPQRHEITANPGGMSPRSLALASGDVIHIQNNTAHGQQFFITAASDSGDGIQSFPALAAGTAADYTVALEGNLELLSEDDENLKTALLSQKNLLGRRVSSGDYYRFENLDPGNYRLIFWYWRLGKIQQTIRINAGENTRVDKTLSVDSVMRYPAAGSDFQNR